MYTLEGWWAGAVRRPWGKWGDWFRDQSADRAELASLDLAGLQRRGVPHDVAAPWLRAPPVASLGCPIRLFDPEYPELLRALPDAPAVIFAEGRTEVFRRRLVAVVGTRRCSTAGAQLAFQVGRTLAEAGLVVVSGLARGIDGAAHHGALQAGQTVAVVGHGLATTSPWGHRELRGQIVQQGAVVTAFADDVGPDRWTFPKRNRWLAGMCEALVVIEAPEGSGAILTALIATELDRDIYAFPGAAGSPLHTGVHDLLRSHAAMLVDTADELRGILVPRVGPARPPWQDALFRGEPLEVVARLRGTHTLELLCELARLEVRGVVVRLPGQRYVEGKGKI